MRRHLTKNVVIVLALIAAGFLVAWLRFRPLLGSEGRYTDGVHHYDVADGGAVRYAVWDRPLPFPGEIGSSDAERSATVSPDGRYLVFCVGERGLGADLYLAELDGGRALEPRPLAPLNSAADEWAPRFGAGALFFASDRVGTSGKLDLYRADYQNGVFGEPVRLAGTINSEADDSDPAPVPGSDAIVFASDRGTGRLAHYDLWIARPTEGADDGTPADWDLEPLAALNSPFDERDPAFTADGRTLFLASDREPTAGGFDLYRSALGTEGWVPPVPLVGVNSPRSERGPSPSRDGFELVFSSEDLRGPQGQVTGELAPEGAEPHAAELYRARSLELFREPGPPVGWRELLVVVALLLLALLAWLAKRWEDLEILYKCVLVSLVVHFLLMWWLRDVYPPETEYELHGESDRIRVRLVADSVSAGARNAERGGELDAARTDAQDERVAARAATAALPVQSDAAPRETAGERARRAADPTPARSGERTLERSSAEPPAVAVTARAEAFERLATAAVPLVSVPSETGGREPVRASESAVRREATSSSSLGEATPDVWRPARGAQSGGSPAARAPGAQASLERPSGETAPQPVAIAHPDEVHRRLEGEASELPLDASRLATRAERSTPSAQRRESTWSTPPPAGSPLPASSPRAPPSRDRIEEPGPSLPDADPASEPLGTARGLPAVALLDGGMEAPPVAAQAPRPSDDLLPQTTAAAELPRNPRSTAPAPRHSPVEPVASIEVERSASARELSRAEPQDPDHLPSTSSEAAPARRSPSPVALPPLRDRIDTPVASREAEVGAPERPRELAVGSLALSETSFDRRREVASSGPQRFQRRERAPDPAPTPSFRALESADRTTAIAAAAPAPPTRWEHTPYRSRAGAEKLRALDLHGGSEETERAVAAGLAYLAEHQARAGHWGSGREWSDKYRRVAIGKTGLATLAFLGAGHTQDSESEYSPVVERALDFLLESQDEPTGHFGNSGAYSHGIATYALAECYALTGDERLRAPLEAAVAWIQEHQHHGRDPRFHGGWGYYYPDGARFDRWPRASVSAWQVMALESARLGGLEVPDDVFADARAFLRNAWDARRGAFRYSHDPQRLNGDYAILPGSTPATIFALSILGDDVSGPEFGPARTFVLERAPRRYRFTGTDDFVHRARGNLYFWYYATLALFRAGGEPWEQWNEAMKATLIAAQEEDGSWRPISVYARDYAGDRDDDRAYTTAMCVLTLEVYYRYFTPLLEVE